MKELKQEELKNIYGGSLSFGALLGIGALITFFIGLVDGYIRPLACNK